MVKRFDFDGWEDFVVKADGDYVYYEDYEKLEEENKYLKQQNIKLEDIKHQLMDTTSQTYREYCKAEDKLAELEKENEGLKKESEELKIPVAILKSRWKYIYGSNK